jgi:multidrug resistance efflux pump
VKRLTLIFIVLGCVGLAAWGSRRLWQKRDAGSNLRQVPVQTKVLGRSLVERGILVSLESAPVRLGANGELLEVTETGTHVQKGDIVVRSDDEDVLEQLEDETFGLYDAEQELAAAQANYDYIEVEQANRLALLTKRLELATLDEKSARVALTPEERRLLDIELEIAELNLKDATEECERQKRLFEKEFISQAMLDPYLRRVETARAAVTEVHERIKLEEKGRPQEELVELRKRVERIEADLERGAQAKARRLKQERQNILSSEAHVTRHREEKARKEEDLAGTAVEAPASGIMAVKLYHSRGTGWVEYGPGIERYKYDHIADIVNPGRMKAEFMVHESDVEHVSDGMTARVVIPAYPGSEFDGVVSEVGGVGRDRADVAPLGYESGRSGITMFNASVSLDARGVDLRPGMSAVVEVVVEEPRPRLVLPRAAVELRENAAVVRVLEDGTPREKVVEGRVLDSLHFEITSGLADGDRVLLPVATEDAS